MENLTIRLVRNYKIIFGQYAILEFTTGLMYGGIYNVIFVLMVELSGPNDRIFGGSLVAMFYSVGAMLAGPVAMYFHNFRTFLRILYTPACLVFASTLLVPESIRWSLSTGRIAQAKRNIIKAAELNKVILSPDTMQLLNNANEHFTTTTTTTKDGSATGQFIRALKSKLIIYRLMICSFCWFAVLFMYVGLTVNSTSLSGNKYINFILVTLVEIPAAIFNFYILKFKRRPTLFVCMIVSGTACVSSQLLPAGTSIGHLLLFIIGKFCITAAYNILFYFTSELFPTNMRQTFVNISSTFGSIGSILAPQTPLLVYVLKFLPIFICLNIIILN